MLDGTADAAGDVQVGGDAGTGLADLVGVWSPAVVGDDARAADGTAEQFILTSHPLTSPSSLFLYLVFFYDNL